MSGLPVKLWRRILPSFQRGLSFLTPKYNQNQTRAKMPNKANLPQPHRVITVSVDGNISSGKSTLVSWLQDLFPNNFGFQVELVPEPLEKWTNLGGHNLLGMFYDDPVKYNFTFQHYVQLTRLMETVKEPAEVREECKGVVRIMERSLQNNRYCFTELARREGRLEQAEFAVLSEWHQWLEKKFDLNLDVIIYLRTEPDTVYGRMQKRGRKEEELVPLEYLKSLHETYEDWLVRGKIGPEADSKEGKENSNSSSLRQKIIVVDANQGKEEVARECGQLIREFMNGIGYQVETETDKQKNTVINGKEKEFTEVK